VFFDKAGSGEATVVPDASDGDLQVSPSTTTTDELSATALFCRNDLGYAPPGRMGLFGALVATLGIVQPVP
jgi:hypothetical protein